MEGLLSTGPNPSSLRYTRKLNECAFNVALKIILKIYISKLQYIFSVDFRGPPLFCPRPLDPQRTLGS